MRESALHDRRGGLRRRAAGAGRKQKPVFTDRLLVTLVHLRHQLQHAALAELYGVDRATVSAAVREIPPLLAARGFAIPTDPSCGCAQWRTSLPTPPRRAWACGSTAPKYRSVEHGQDARAAKRSSP
ncbi:transposase family protein [Streptomyces sp. ok210]|uniref:helix-turn-helix domain-containing protein n=1 Tax=Streptomyces sp. ok210 TaxID=1761905 RepID=UPI003525662E